MERQTQCGLARDNRPPSGAQSRSGFQRSKCALRGELGQGAQFIFFQQRKRDSQRLSIRDMAQFKAASVSLNQDLAKNPFGSKGRDEGG